ncbi:dihydrofolate reductase [Xenorhabdus sp. PR6a]|uniref:dihydrofolate reductase n=1 Tax=Xenorhabdus sp. PR6a TaxID=3025877 RepID=UPI002358BE52|nr:dihydrofolate reductase [Xenorhabdus sp. PR6a]MDC9581928.1 dihydrofolate reductase [Xenorhabdus sp. PR6a]
MISLIAAVGRGNGIGVNNALPWHSSRDLKLFKNKTVGEIVVMGRKTAESLGKPLKDRFNFVLSRNPNRVPAGFSIIRDISEVKDLARLHSVYIIGGAEIYRQFIDIADRAFISHIEADTPDADTFFPMDELKAAFNRRMTLNYYDELENEPAFDHVMYWKQKE